MNIAVSPLAGGGMGRVEASVCEDRSDTAEDRVTDGAASVGSQSMIQGAREERFVRFTGGEHEEIGQRHPRAQLELCPPR